MDAEKQQKLFGVGPVGALISLVLLIVAVWVDRILEHPAILTNPTPIKVIGAVLVVIGLGLHFWSMWTLRNWWGRDELCIQGPFKRFRHPMYAAWITFVLPGMALYLNSWIILFFVILLHPIWHEACHSGRKNDVREISRRISRICGANWKVFPSDMAQ
jgi:protein-S-isoprenylcysteine O-methyltransferase Ste14